MLSREQIQAIIATPPLSISYEHNDDDEGHVVYGQLDEEGFGKGERSARHSFTSGSLVTIGSVKWCWANWDELNAIITAASKDIMMTQPLWKFSRLQFRFDLRESYCVDEELVELLIVHRDFLARSDEPKDRSALAVSALHDIIYSENYVKTHNLDASLVGNVDHTELGLLVQANIRSRQFAREFGILGRLNRLHFERREQPEVKKYRHIIYSTCRAISNTRKNSLKFLFCLVNVHLFII
jgi:hypothetical protein